MARKKSRSAKAKSVNTKRFILNCIPSIRPEDDWTFEDAVAAGVVDVAATIPATKDLRAVWWPVDDQDGTGACVGFATAYGVLRWHYVDAGLLKKSKRIPPRSRLQGSSGWPIRKRMR